MGSTRIAELWFAVDKVHGLFGIISDNTITFESGASIWVPSQPDHHMLRGLKYPATGTPLQLQQLACKLISQLAQPEEFHLDSEAKQWWYLNDQDVQFGPFSGQQLCKFHRSGVWAPDFPVCYGPAAVWLPIWLVLQLLGLDSQQPPKAAAAAAAAPARKQPVQTSSTAVAERHEEEYTATRRVRHKYHASGQHEKIAGSPGASWRLSSSIQTSPAAAAAAAAGARSSRHLQAGSDGMTDAETEEMSAAEMLAEVAALRQDSAYIEELSRAVDMDWEPLQQQQQQLLPQASGMPSDDASDFPATGLAGLGGICGSRGSPRGSTAAAQQLLLQLVVDTNVLLNSKGLLLLQQLQEAQHGGCGVLQLLVVLPWTVLVELDKLKTRAAVPADGQSVALQARAAVRHLQSVMGQHSSTRHMYKAQSMQEFRDAAREFHFGVSDRSLVADDRILQCALHISQQQQGQGKRQRQQASSGVLLLTNDHVLQLKAQANSIPAASLRDVPIGSASQQQQLLLLAKLAHLAGMDSRIFADSNVAEAATAAAGAAEASESHPVSYGTAADSGRQHRQCKRDSAEQRQQQHSQGTRQQEQQDDRQTNAAVAAAALSHVTQLRLGLSGKVTAMLKAEFEELWLDVVSSKPPWRDIDFLHVLHKHWGSVLQDRLAPHCRSQGKQLQAAVQYLIDTHKQLRRHDYSQLPMAQLEQNVALRVVQLLEVFGAAAAAADVAASAGLGSSSGAVARALGSGVGGTLATSGAGLDRAGSGMGAGLNVQSSSWEGARAGQQKGSRKGVVQATLAAAGDAQAALAKATIAAASATAGQVAAAASPGTATAAAAVPAMVAGAAAGSSSLHHAAADRVEAAAAAGHHRITKHAVRHQKLQQQQQGQAAHSDTTGQKSFVVHSSEQQCNKKHCAAGQEQAEQQHSHVLLALHQHGSQEVQIHSYLTQQQQQQQQHGISTASQAAILASAAAAVPAPQLQGPCLRLQQLLQYTLALLCAIMQPLQQMLQQAPAAVITAMVQAAGTMQQQMQQAVEALEWIMGVIMQSIKQQEQHQQGMTAGLHTVVAAVAAAVAPSVHQQVLQAALLLVQLCAQLLANTAAGAAVMEQITGNAVQFVQDALEFFASGQLESRWPAGSAVQQSEPALAVQQLKAAQQHLQLLLSQAQLSLQPSS